MQLTFKILGIPKPKQSARFRAIKMGEKTFVQSYQSKEVKDNERNLAYDIKSQLPEGFVPLDCGIFLKTVFVFPVVSSMSKKVIAAIEAGEKVYKITRPDLPDNLKKSLIDSMKGIVFTDDARICKEEGEKIYGLVPMTVVEINDITG